MAGTAEQGSPVATSSFTGTGAGASAVLRPGYFNFGLVGGVGTVKLEKSYDNGTTWLDDSMDAAGTVASWTLASGDEVNVVGFEPEGRVLYRANCTAYTSGTITTRIGQ